MHVILHTQSEYIWCLLPTRGISPAFRDDDGVQLLFIIPSTAIGPVPSISGRAIAYRWRSLPRVRRRRASSPQCSSSNRSYLFRHHRRSVFVSLSFPHTHYYYYHYSLLILLQVVVLKYILFVTQLPSLERWALLPFLGFPPLTCFLFFLNLLFLETHAIFFSRVLGLFLGLFYFIFIFLYLILGSLVVVVVFALKAVLISTQYFLTSVLVQLTRTPSVVTG